MKNPFSYVKGLILKYTQETPELRQTKAQHRGIVASFVDNLKFKRSLKKAETFATQSGMDLTRLDPDKYLDAKEIRRRAMLSSEAEATQRAVEMIQYAMQNPDDPTARLGKKKAIEYLNRNKELESKGALQNMNRKTIADRYIESDLSSIEGQQERKQKQLDQFNYNFGLNLTPEQWETMDKLIQSEAFQKQKELLGQQYRTLFEAVGDAIENNVDPVRIEQTLDLYTRLGVDDYEMFADITQMRDDVFADFYEEAIAKIGEQSGMETYEINEGLYNILDRYK